MTAMSVLFTTVMSVVQQTVALQVPAVPAGPAILEIGGSSATCEAIDQCGDCIEVAEPVMFEDLVKGYGDIVHELGLATAEFAVKKAEPRELWIHANPAWTEDGVYEDIIDCIEHQLQAGRAVVFERDPDEIEFWEQLLEEWEHPKFYTLRDHTKAGNEYLRVSTIFPNEIFVANAENRDAPPDEHRLGASGIDFPRGTAPHIASALRRLHQNLGHPSGPDLARHLRLAGASRDVVKIAKNLRCQTCSRCQRPGVAKPAKAGHLLRFNELIGADLFYVHDVNNIKHELLSVVDQSSGYHVVLPLAKKDTATLEKALCDGWLHVFGIPDGISIDLETGLQKALARLGDWLGFKVRSAAGQAHWQAGYTERQGALWKNMFQRVCEEKNVDKSDMPAAIAAISHAKNSLRKVNGFSPRQHVFGSDEALPEDLVDGPHAHEPPTLRVMDDKHAREVAIRTAARAAYHHVQTDDRVRRALAGRARVQARVPDIGERVFFYRLARNNKRGTWQGPGVVIGREQENIWVSKGGRCLLCAPEHVRLATNEELGEMFTLRASQADLERLLNADQEDEEVFVDNRPGHAGQGDGGDDPGFAEDMFVDEDEGDAPIELIEEDADDEADDHPVPDNDEHGYRPVRARDRRPRPGPLRRHRRKGPEYYTEAVHEAWMLKKATTKRSLEKQLEKEIPWRLIPADKREAFQEAESKQWAEHLDHKAIEVLDVATLTSSTSGSTCPPTTKRALGRHGTVGSTRRRPRFLSLYAYRLGNIRRGSTRS